MGMWDGMNEAEADGRIYFQPGRYIVEIECCKAIEAHESFRGHPSFIVECTIVQSTCAALPPGTQGVGWVQPIKSGKNQRALAQTTIKRFLQAVMNDESMGGMSAEQLAPVVTSDANPLHGLRVALTCTQKGTQAGGDFTKHLWEAIPAAPSGV